MQPHISPQDLANNEIVQACMRQGNFTDINAYIESDNTLSEFMEKQNLSKEMVNAQLGMVRGKMDKLNHATDNASSLAPTPPKTNHSVNFSNLSKQNDTRMGR